MLWRKCGAGKAFNFFTSNRDQYTWTKLPIGWNSLWIKCSHFCNFPKLIIDNHPTSHRDWSCVWQWKSKQGMNFFSQQRSFELHLDTFLFYLVFLSGSTQKIRARISSFAGWPWDLILHVNPVVSLKWTRQQRGCGLTNLFWDFFLVQTFSWSAECVKPLLVLIIHELVLPSSTQWNNNDIKLICMEIPCRHLR